MHCFTLLTALFLCGSSVTATGLAPNHAQNHAQYPRHQVQHQARHGGGKHESPRAVAYYGNWDIYARNFFITDVPFQNFTHLVYAFANVNNVTGEVYLSDEWADVQYPYPNDVVTNATAANTTNLYGNIRQMYLLKQQNRNLKTMLAILGYTYSPNMPPVLRSPTLRANFISSAVSLMTNLGFDGLDMDYEYVANATEAADMVTLLRDLRAAMDALPPANGTASRYLLSYASPAGPARYGVLDMAGMDQYLDFWNLMAFDYVGTWEPLSGHMSNLYGDKSNPASTPYNTSQAVDAYIAAGVAPSKINLGMPLYARSFANTAGPGQPFNNTGITGAFDEAGIWDTKNLPIANATVHNLKSVGASYSYDAGSRYMMTYDTPEIAKVKAKYIHQQKLGGAFWWEVSQDSNGTDSLIGTVVSEFGGPQRFEKSENRLSYPDSRYENLRSMMRDI